MDIELTRDRVAQTFDLEEITGIDMSNRPDLAVAIAQEMLDFMVNRVESGRGFDGRSIRSGGYSEEYRDSLEFAAFDKTNRVNMTLTGDMLADMDILNLSGNQLEIGFVNETQRLKAFNHNTGDTVPERRFFGLSPRETREVISRFDVEIQEIQEQVEITTNPTDNNEDNPIRDLGVILSGPVTTQAQQESAFNRILDLFGDVFGEDQ